MSLTSRDFQRPDHKQFYDELRSCDRAGGVQFYTLFEDFVTLASCSIRQSVSKITTGALSDEIEEDYMRTVRKYPKENVAGFARAVAVLVEGLESGLHDFLGDVFTCTGISSHWSGQYFTPWPLCQAMAKMTIGEPKPSTKRLTICEPCVGGGALLLAVAAELKTLKFAPWHWWFEATDVDRRCAMMSYVQLSLAGCPGIVRHGNSLSGQQWSAWATPTGALFPHFWPKAEPSNEPPVMPGTTQFVFDLAA